MQSIVTNEWAVNAPLKERLELIYVDAHGS
jgi:hypothetical protein